MTLVVDRRIDGPGIHLLAIGVGAYRHLPGGEQPVRHDTLGLRQLSSPPISAVSFTHFVCRRLRHPTARLSSVELLLSPDHAWLGADGPVAVDRPSMARVKRAVEDWFERCDRDPHGLGLFYFCGHGVQRETMMLLVEDFGQSALSMLDDAVDIMATYDAMAACAVRTQYFFVDACREVPHQLLYRLRGSARVLVDLEVDRDDRDCGLLFAASGGHKAYARPGRSTRFTSALIRAWDGLGANPRGASWAVNFAGLYSATTTLLHREEPDAPRQQPQSHGMSGNPVLHICPEPPVVPLRVLCRPDEAAGNPGVTAALARAGSTATTALQRYGWGWQAELPVGNYRLDVAAPAPYRSYAGPVTAWPPGDDLPVDLGGPK